MDLVSTHPTDPMSNVIHDILLLVVEIIQMDLVSTHPTDPMSNVIHDILLLAAEIHTDGLGFYTSYRSHV